MLSRFAPRRPAWFVATLNRPKTPDVDLPA
jgi:hypothetical protein